MISVDINSNGVEVLLHDVSGTQVLPPLWLRERSLAPDQMDAGTQQRLVDPHRWSADLAIEAAEVVGEAVHVHFSDGHEETFAFAELARTLGMPDGIPAPMPWRADAGRPQLHDWDAVRSEPKALLDALADFLARGTIVVAGVPSEPGAVLTVAERFGIVRDTNWGRLFDVRSVPNPNDLAYTAVPLGPHTDNPYRDPTPGIQLLHCLVNETSGGLSTLVDAIAVTDQLRHEDPDGFELLATVPVQFRFVDATDDLRYVRPVVMRDHAGQVTGLAYSPRLDYLPVMSPADTRAYQQARRRLSELLVDPEFEIKFVLQPGEVEMFDNSRVLHGRTGFDPHEGRRHLQGCYIDGDAPRSRYRMLKRPGVL